MRLIDADKLKKSMAESVTVLKFNQEFDGLIAEFIDNAPTVVPEDFMNSYEEGYERARKDFERPTGYWYLETGDLWWHCSVCHDCIQDIAANEFVTATNPYCKHCGAKMEVKK